MPTLTNTHPGYLDDRGGRPVSVRVEWTAAEIGNHGKITAPIGRLPHDIQWRIGLCPMTSLGPPATWDPPVAYIYGGVPGQGRIVYANPTDLGSARALEYLHGWAPLVPMGVYWLSVEWFDPTGAGWTAIIGSNPLYGADGYCDDAAILIPRMRHAEVYRTRQGFPTPPFLVGPRFVQDDPILPTTP